MKIRDITLIALFTALISICSQITIPIQPVPITGAIIGIFITGAVLEKKQGLIVGIVYLLLGAVGIPVFAGFGAGISSIIGPTGGYLVTYPIMIYLIAWCIEKFKKENIVFLTLYMVFSLVPCYVVGTIWLAISCKLGIYEAILAGVAPFVVFDIIKGVVGAFIAATINRALVKGHIYERN